MQRILAYLFLVSFSATAAVASTSSSLMDDPPSSVVFFDAEEMGSTAASGSPPPEPVQVSANDYSSSRDLASYAAAAGPVPALPVEANSGPPPRFHWTPALLEAGQYMLMQHIAIFAMDTSKYGLYSWWPDPFWQNYVESVEGLHGWDDGDPFIDNYIGHPVQGAITGFIQIQNDDRGKQSRFGKSGDYWRSRMKATAFATAYSTFFELGPLGEAGVENLGRMQRFRPCQGGTATCRYSEMAWVDLVITPVGGLGWLLMEDALDRFVIEKADRKHGLVRGAARSLLNPARSFANMLRFKAPWHRDRDEQISVAFGAPAAPAATAAER
jgi:hypothetical protein